MFLIPHPPKNRLRGKLQIMFQVPRKYVDITVKWNENNVNILETCMEFIYPH